MSEPNRRVRRLFEPLLRLLLPSSGRHRAAVPAALSVPDPLRAPAPFPARQPVLLSPRDDVAALVRPYVLTPDQRRERRCQRGRRRALWLAVHGIDVGPRWIHGVRVATR